jgi:hypothetical protein
VIVKSENEYYNVNVSTISKITKDNGYLNVEISGKWWLHFFKGDLKKFFDFIKESEKYAIIDEKELSEMIR